MKGSRIQAENLERMIERQAGPPQLTGLQAEIWSQNLEHREWNDYLRSLQYRKPASGRDIHSGHDHLLTLDCYTNHDPTTPPLPLLRLN